MSYDEYYDEPDAQEVLSILRGEAGPEAQARMGAAAGLEIVNYEGKYSDDPDEDAWAREFVGQVNRLEKKLGRELTGKEVKALGDDAIESGQPPDLLESYDRVVGRNQRNSDDRRAIAAEVYDEENELRDAEQHLERDGWDANDSTVQGAVGPVEAAAE